MLDTIKTIPLPNRLDIAANASQSVPINILKGVTRVPSPSLSFLNAPYRAFDSMNEAVNRGLDASLDRLLRATSGYSK